MKCKPKLAHWHWQANNRWKGAANTINIQQLFYPPGILLRILITLDGLNHWSYQKYWGICRSEKKGYILIFYVSIFLSTPPPSPLHQILLMRLMTSEQKRMWAGISVSNLIKEFGNFFAMIRAFFMKCIWHFFGGKIRKTKLLMPGGCQNSSDSLEYSQSFNITVRTEFIIIISL